MKSMLNAETVTFHLLSLLQLRRDIPAKIKSQRLLRVTDSLSCFAGLKLIPFSSLFLVPSNDQMKRTQRFNFKRVSIPRKPNTQSTQPDNDDPEPPRVQRLKRQPRTIPLPLPTPPSLDAITILPPEFFQIDALDLAPRLLGKFLRREDVVLQITEVEAYRPNDSACHARFGVTSRTAPMFGPGGHAYVYLCYGLHSMLNVVADKEGVGAAVLIRACAPICGLDTIQQRRGQNTEKPVLLTGPGKIGQALGISTEWSHHALYTPGGLEILDGPEPAEILVGPRVGIEYASPEHANALWRFAIAGSAWISAPKNSLRLPRLPCKLYE